MKKIIVAFAFAALLSACSDKAEVPKTVEQVKPVAEAAQPKQPGDVMYIAPKKAVNFNDYKGKL